MCWPFGTSDTVAHSLLETCSLFALRTPLDSPPAPLVASSHLPLLVPPPLHLQMPVSLGGLTSTCMHSPGDLLCFVALDSISESPFLLPAWPWSLNSRRPRFRFAARCLRDAFSLAHAQLNPWKHPCSVTPGTPILLLVAQVQSLGIPFSLPSPSHPSANPFPNLIGCLFTPEAESDHFPSFLCGQPGPLPHRSSLGCCRCLQWAPCSHPGLPAASVPF